MTDEDLCYLTAKEALKLFRTRKVSPVEILKAQIARSETVNPAINCITDRYFDEALEQAKVAEAAYAKKSGGARPLEGVTLAVVPLRVLAERDGVLDQLERRGLEIAGPAWR